MISLISNLEFIHNLMLYEEMVEMGKYWYRRARHKMPSAYLVQTITRIECDRNIMQQHIMI